MDTSNPAMIDLLAQLDSILAAPRPFHIQSNAPAAALPAAKRSPARIVAIAEEDRIALIPGMDVDAIRAAALATVDAYLAESVVTRRLLLNLPPGIGKSWLGVYAAHKAQMQGLRVAYIMPRHAFFNTLVEMSDQQGYGSGYWYQWQPRRGEDENGNGETCHRSGEITQWIKKGHQGAKFCGGVCGYEFMQNACIYHGQKDRIALRSGDGIVPIVAIQHAHLVTGHTMMHDPGFDLVIGDESPLGAYPWIWEIPAKHLIDKTKLGKKKLPVSEFMLKLDSLARTMASDITLEGPALIEALGGVVHVQAAIAKTLFPDTPLSINQVESADSAPYDYLATLCELLRNEARAGAAGSEYISRAILRPEGLTLLLKKSTTQDMPAKVIWLDATASPELYSTVTKWRIESFAKPAKLAGPIMQITEGVFSKTSMVRNEKPSPAAQQTARIIDHLIEREGYTNPLIVSYQHLAPLFSQHRFTYFHGNRGTNEYESCDAVFILGTPQPPIDQIEMLGRMFYPRRMEPFNATWCKKPVPYAGHDRGYDASGLWLEPELQIVLDQLREQEIVQSAHRVRPILSPKPIWLFTALPVAALPPTHLYTLLEAINVQMDGIDASTFLDALDIAETTIAEHGHCTSQHMSELLDVTPQTAYKYLAALAQYDPEQYAPMEVKAIGRGRPRRAIGRIV